MPPVIGTGVCCIDADLFDGIDRLQHALDLRPAGDSQEDFPARPHIGDGREAFPPSDGAEDVDPRDDSAEVARRPANLSDNAVWREGQYTAAAIEDLLRDIAAEADPVLDPLLEPDQFYVGERILMEAGGDHGAPLRTFPPSRRWPTTEELDSCELDSELGEPEAVGALDEFGRAGS
jgi:hypothetical protein